MSPPNHKRAKKLFSATYNLFRKKIVDKNIVGSPLFVLISKAKKNLTIFWAPSITLFLVPHHQICKISDSIECQHFFVFAEKNFDVWN